ARLAHDGSVWSVVFSPDGSRVATASDDGTARVFDAVSGAEQARLAHDGWVRAVVFSPDGSRVATASDDGTARVFDAVSGVEQARLAHDGSVNAVVFSPDGSQVATASDDGTARVSPVDPGLLLDAVEQRIPRPLTDAEWERCGGRPIAQHDTGVLRSTVSVDEELLAAARPRARRRGQTLGEFVESSLRRDLAATGDTDDR
ncbi:MAG: WD40 repeat domain-containing protein, partial [Pseudonocardiaceae bacterium]